jgi:hypothetical protein
MKTAKTSVTTSNIDVRVLGEFSADEALYAFDNYPWKEELRQLERLDAEGKSCASPDMTFSTLPYHFTVTVQDVSPTLDVELCVPKKSKLLGMMPIASTKFFQFKKVSRKELEALLRAFLSVPADEQLAFFSAFNRA